MEGRWERPLGIFIMGLVFFFWFFVFCFFFFGSGVGGQILSTGDRVAELDICV